MKMRRKLGIKVLMVVVGLLLIPLSVAGCAEAGKEPFKVADAG